MVIDGLWQKGYKKEAREIALNHYHQVLEVFKKTGTFFEYYAPETMDPGFMARKEFIGWTGLAPIGEFLEFIIGIRADYPENTITWDLNLTEANGVERYPFGPEGNITMKAAKRASASAEPRITIDSNVAFTLKVFYANKSKTINVEPGNKTY